MLHVPKKQAVESREDVIRDNLTLPPQINSRRVESLNKIENTKILSQLWPIWYEYKDFHNDLDWKKNFNEKRDQLQKNKGVQK